MSEARLSKMKRAAALGAALLAHAGCGPADPTGTDKGQQVSYQVEIQDIWDRRCSVCHSAEVEDEHEHEPGHVHEEDPGHEHEEEPGHVHEEGHVHLHGELD